MQATNTANVVGGKLILSFITAKTPVVWQMDLNKAQSCALEVKEDTKKKEFSLCLKADSKDSEEIAVFETKEQAIEALMTTSAALQNADNQIGQPAATATIQPSGIVSPYPAHQITPQQRKNENKKAAILAFILVIVLIIIWSVSVPRNSGPLLSSNQLGNTGTRGSVSGESAAGVPLSADDFLTNR